MREMLAGIGHHRLTSLDLVGCYLSPSKSWTSHYGAEEKLYGNRSDQSAP